MFEHEDKIRMVIAGLERSLDIMSQITPSNHKDELLVRIMDMRGKLSEILHELHWQRERQIAETRERQRAEIEDAKNDLVMPRMAPSPEELSLIVDKISGLPIKKEPKKEGDEVIYDESQ